MTYKHLRAFMKRISPPVDYTLKNCDLVIDGRSFFKGTYKQSGCQSILGGEYDRYADYLKSLLKPFKESNINCYVIFNGCMDANLEKRKEIHQKVIDNVDKIDPGDEAAYCEPIFVKDVWKEVLDELKIKYFTTEHDSWAVIFWVAQIFKCPILTNNYEYSLRYMNCISPKSLVYHENSKEILCSIFESNNVRSNFKVKHTVLPLFYTLLDESSVYIKKLSLIVNCLKQNDLMSKVLKWTRWTAYGLEETLQKIQEILSEEEAEQFFDAYHRNEELCKTKQHMPAVKHFRQNNNNGNHVLPIPYINLIRHGTFSGSWVIFDKEQEDAMHAAFDIIFYACKRLKFKRDAKITFIGRRNDKTCIWDVEKDWEELSVSESDLFKNFVYETMPGFDFKNLETIPEESWLLIIALVYYCQIRSDLKLAYSMILSYVMMGPVSENIGIIKRTNFISPDVTESDDKDRYGLKTKDCMAVIDSMMDLFYAKNLKRHFSRQILHTFAEFQHCLQHINYLNKLCGKTVKTTVYHKTINVTFAYNIYRKIMDKTDHYKYIEKRLKKSTVFDCYKRIERVFEACLISVGLGLVQKMSSLETRD